MCFFACHISSGESCLQEFLITKYFSWIRSVRSAMHKYLERENEVTFDKIFNQKIGRSSTVYATMIVIDCLLSRFPTLQRLLWELSWRASATAEVLRGNSQFREDGMSRRAKKTGEINLRQLHNEGDVESRTRELYMLWFWLLTNNTSHRNTPKSALLTSTVSYKRTKFQRISSSHTSKRFSIICVAILSSALWRVHATQDSFSGKISSLIWR